MGKNFFVVLFISLFLGFQFAFAIFGFITAVFVLFIDPSMWINITAFAIIPGLVSSAIIFRFISNAKVSFDEYVKGLKNGR